MLIRLLLIQFLFYGLWLTRCSGQTAGVEFSGALRADQAVVFDADVAGQSVKLMFDPTRGPNLFDFAMSRYLGDQLASGPLFDTNGLGNQFPFPAPEIKLGRLRLHDGLSYAVALDPVIASIKVPVAGAIGFQAVADMQMDFCYSEGVFSFRRDSGAGFFSGWQPQDLGWSDTLGPMFPEVSCGAVKLDDCQFSPSGDQYLTVTADCFSELLKQGELQQIGDESEAIGGGRKGLFGVVSELNIAGHSLRHVPVFTGASNKLAKGVLSKFDIKLDFKRRLYALRPHSNQMMPRIERHSGILVVWVHDVFLIVLVDPGGIGDLAGLQAGDQIMAIDDRSCREWSTWTVRSKVCFLGHEPTKMRIMRNGKPKNVVIEAMEEPNSEVKKQRLNQSGGDR